MTSQDAVLPVVPIPPPRAGESASAGAFAIGATPVTNAQYGPFVEAGRAPAPPWWEDAAFASPRQPVVGVTWDEAAGFAAWLSEGTGEPWRLPTEAEWELAMTAGEPDPPTAWGLASAPPPGEIPDGPLAGPWETGRGTPNAWGILDPGTVVHEWCADWADQTAAAASAGHPAGHSGGPRRRASRGGSWRHRVRWSRPSARSSLPPDYRYSDYGFRVVRG